MPTSLFPELGCEASMFSGDPQRIARAAILNGVAIPPLVSAYLEARGINVGELEQRIRDTMESKR